MLYIVRQYDVDIAKREEETHARDYKWHVGCDVPCLVGGRKFRDVCEIRADGLELEYIRLRFKNLPDVEGAKMVQWRGDIAQFIYDHLSRHTQD